MANNGSASDFSRTVSPTKIEDVWSVMGGYPPQDFPPTTIIAQLQSSLTCPRCLWLFSSLVQDSI
jgi:hypothetical protein